MGGSGRAEGIYAFTRDVLGCFRPRARLALKRSLSGPLDVWQRGRGENQNNIY